MEKVFSLNQIQKYFRYRQGLIDQYVKGDMSKREYLAKNLDAVLSLRKDPFINADTLEKGLFNYQYFNALAKEAKASEPGERPGEPVGWRRSDYYYEKKDKATLNVLKILGYKGVAAYFIRVRSPHLKGRLFEIIIEEYQMILHSANPLILKMLRDEGAFIEETRESVIDGYINQKY
ncbi:MAG: hypothetical protein LBU32_06905 [Clostridiales bacterium]|nr:hypothetical protein [Clostridiales bacterium]